MQPRRRHVLILSALDRGSFVSLREAVELTGASEATVRRDFLTLEEAGEVHRFRGGIERRTHGDPTGMASATDRADPSPPLASAPLEARLVLREEAKRLIAERSARLCEPGMTLFLDAGSTALRLAELIADMRVRIITNSFAAARLLVEKGRAEVMVTAGQIDRASGVVFSYVDDPLIESYPADISFLSAQGVDASGVWNSDERLIRLERRVVATAKRSVLLADASKFGTSGRIRLCGLDEIDQVVVEPGLGREYRQLVRDAGCTLLEVR